MHSYLTLPVSLFFTVGAAFWIAGELLYALVSCLENNAGDFGLIRQNGPLHLLVATAAIVGVVALGVIGSLAVMA